MKWWSWVPRVLTQHEPGNSLTLGGPPCAPLLHPPSYASPSGCNLPHSSGGGAAGGVRQQVEACSGYTGDLNCENHLLWRGTCARTQPSLEEVRLSCGRLLHRQGPSGSCAWRYRQAWDLDEAGAGPSEPVGAPVSECRGLCRVLQGPFLGLWLRRLCRMPSYHSLTPPDSSWGSSPSAPLKELCWSSQGTHWRPRAEPRAPRTRQIQPLPVLLWPGFETGWMQKTESKEECFGWEHTFKDEIGKIPS